MAIHEGALYDVTRSFEENMLGGPFGGYSPDAPPYGRSTQESPTYDFFGTLVDTPFGIGAGPLPGRRFIAAAFRQGYSIATHKSVRTSGYPCHPYPNILPVKLDELDPTTLDHPITIATRYAGGLAIANSFGIPSSGPHIWQPQIAEALETVRPGEALLVAFQGTDRGEGRQAFIGDHVTGVRLLRTTGARAVEVNLSCPNEGSKELLCFDPITTRDIVLAIREAVADIQLIVKITHFSDTLELRRFVELVGPYVHGITAINTVGGRVTTPDGQQAFPGGPERAKPGISGRPIKHLGIGMVKRLADLRQELGLSFKIIGIGGVMDADDFKDYRRNQADIVMSVTGAMWNAHLAREIRLALQNG